ncbi:DNA alkylation repair protein [Spongisporangium articulatum]|uniref:DNA alkylation repair protein n=1 Tax=Spongisporangium articulatum TaxID=3362603 RepID=A0ABW8AHK4_9ACTN
MLEPVDQVAAELRAAGTPERAEGSKAYLHSELEFFGATVAAVRAAARRARREATTRSEALALVEGLWARPVFELRLAAALVLVDAVPQLEARDLAVVEGLVRESHTWALVDVLAGDCAGPLVTRLEADGADLTPVLDRWAVDEDFWVRRCALLVHERALRAGAGDWARFTRYADAMLEEREFFIRKAIGWVLRSASKRRPDLVRAWVEPRLERMSGVTRREAVKYL